MSADQYVPRREDHFSFGIWTVGWQGTDVFGTAVRPPMPAERAVRKLAELGAYGVNFHDNDLVPIDATAAERDRIVAGFKRALEAAGMVVIEAAASALHGEQALAVGGRDHANIALDFDVRIARSRPSGSERQIRSTSDLPTGQGITGRHFARVSLSWEHHDASCNCIAC